MLRATPFRVTARPVLNRLAIVLSVLSIMLNGLIGGLSVGLALTTNSLTLVGFGATALIDAGACTALVWQLLTLTRQPERADRVGRLADRVAGLLLGLLGAYLALSAARSLQAGTRPEFPDTAAGLLIASLAILLPIGLANYVLGRSQGSRRMRADGERTALVALLAAISLGSMALHQVFGAAWVDNVAALAVAAIVGRAGWSSVLASRSAAAA